MRRVQVWKAKLCEYRSGHMEPRQKRGRTLSMMHPNATAACRLVSSPFEAAVALISCCKNMAKLLTCGKNQTKRVCRLYKSLQIVQESSHEGQLTS